MPIEITDKSQVINESGYTIQFDKMTGTIHLPIAHGNEDWCLGANADTCYIFPSFDDALNFCARNELDVTKFVIRKIKRTSIIELD